MISAEPFLWRSDTRPSFSYRASSAYLSSAISSLLIKSVSFNLKLVKLNIEVNDLQNNNTAKASNLGGFHRLFNPLRPEVYSTRNNRVASMKLPVKRAPRARKVHNKARQTAYTHVNISLLPFYLRYLVTVGNQIHANPNLKHHRSNCRALSIITSKQT